MQTFIQNFVPERGDLVYGIRDTRTAYFTNWQTHMQTADINRLVDFLTMSGNYKPNWNIIDNFNDYFFLGGAVDFSESGSKAEVPHQLYARLTSVSHTLSSSANSTKKSEQIDQRAGYAYGLLNSRYSPASTFDASDARLSREGFSENFQRHGKKIGRNGALEDNRAYLAIRRACKFGIGMAASHGAFVGNSVHFLLDGLDMVEVAKKSERVGSGGRTSVSITTSELRYVFRHWNTLKSVVKFYVNFTQVAAPWEEDWTLATIPNCAPDPIRAELVEWGNYFTARLEKYNGKLPDKDLV